MKKTITTRSDYSIALIELKRRFNIHRDLTPEEFDWFLQYYRDEKPPIKPESVDVFNNKPFQENERGRQFIQMLEQSEAIIYAAKHPPDKWPETQPLGFFME